MSWPGGVILIPSNRGVSTVVDVVVALSLVSAAAVVLVTVEQPATTARWNGLTTDTGATVLSTTLTVSYDGPTGPRVVRGPAGVLLADAARAAAPPVTDTEAAYIEATRAELRALLGPTEPRMTVAAIAGDDTRLEVGSHPPAGVNVDAITYRFSSNRSGGPEPVTLVVRTWSP